MPTDTAARLGPPHLLDDEYPHAEARRIGHPFLRDATRDDVPFGWTGIVRRLAATLAAHVQDDPNNPMTVAAILRRGPELLVFLDHGGPMARRVAVDVVERVQRDVGRLDSQTGVPSPEGAHALLAALRDDLLAEDACLVQASLDQAEPGGRTHRRRVADLRRDLEGLDPRRRGRPARAEFEGAPILEGWRLLFAPGETQVSLLGQVRDHSYIGEGRSAVTSPVVALDPGRTWARTMSRYYRLGDPVPAGHLTQDA